MSLLFLLFLLLQPFCCCCYYFYCCCCCRCFFIVLLLLILLHPCFADTPAGSLHASEETESTTSISCCENLLSRNKAALIAKMSSDSRHGIFQDMCLESCLGLGTGCPEIVLNSVLKNLQISMKLSRNLRMSRDMLIKT